MFGQGALNACYAKGIQNMKRPKTTSVFEKKVVFPYKDMHDNDYL